MNNISQSIENFVGKQNERKLLFTPGPASLLPENLTGLQPCFGRGDGAYDELETRVLDSIRALAGQEHIVRMQGSASLALEIMALNFLSGRVLVVSTGYYSDRLMWLAESAMRRQGAIKEVLGCEWDKLETVRGPIDWVFACYTETSVGLKIPIGILTDTAKRLGGRLMLDATASIGLEDGHNLAEVTGFSSCKGLFGLTGGCFITFNDAPTIEVDSFFMNIHSHLEKKMTGPYHAIASLDDVMPKHADFKVAVVENKMAFTEKMKNWLSLPTENQPLLCTHVNCKVTSDDPRAILYKPRVDRPGSVVCHLGEVHLSNQACGKIIEALNFDE